LSGKDRAETFRTHNFCGWCSDDLRNFNAISRFPGEFEDYNHYVTFDLLVGLTNGQSIMGDHSQEEHALMKIQHEWAEARIKGDSSYTRQLETEDCTIVWPDGSIVNKRADLQSMTDIEFSEFKIQDLQVRLYGDTGVVVGEGMIKAQKGNQDLLVGKFVWTDTFVKQGDQWKVVASQITPVLEK